MKRWTRRAGGVPLLATLLTIVAGCGGTGGSYVHPNVDFGYMKRAAVLPFQNLTPDELADERIQSIFLMELLEADILEIVDPRETVAAMQSLGLTPGRPLTPEQIVELGEKLSVEAVFFGAVEEYGISPSDRRRGPEITIVLAMSETQTGIVVWRAQAHNTGASIWRKLFGGGSADLYTVSQETVHDALRTLL
jgi:hypothetical protein